MQGLCVTFQTSQLTGLNGILQVLGGRLPKRPLWSYSVDPCLPDLLDSTGKIGFRFPEVARASAFAKADSPDLFVDMPDITLLVETWLEGSF